MKGYRVRAFALVALLGPCVATAMGQGPPPPGYQITKISSGLTTAEIENITQMAFKPGDDTHLYASRFGFRNAPTENGVVTRYDYNPTTGALSNPVDVATNLGIPLGLAFHGDDLFVTNTQNYAAADSTGGIVRLQPTGGGLYGNPVEFVNNVPLGEHQIDQLQIVGDSLYVGIGTRSNTGTDPTRPETVYNGAIGFIADLTKADFSANGANNLPLADVPTSTDPGKLRVFASGFRNPYGVRVIDGNVFTGDNGADVPDLTPDLFYHHLQLGDKGIFPPPGTGATVQPLAQMGLDTSADGSTILQHGPLAGRYLVALFSNGENGSNLPGNQLVTVDPATGAVSNFIADLGNPLDVMLDPFGRVLVNDYGPSFANNFDPNSGAVYLISAVPEPASALLLLAGLGTLGGLARRRRR